MEESPQNLPSSLEDSPPAERFTVYTAIDLRGGQVVRLQQGDPGRQTTFSSDPAAVARRWLQAGARWLHVVNLDGAFDQGDAENQRALAAILEQAARYGTRVQFGGGLRSLPALHKAFEAGVERAVLGTAAVEQPDLLALALETFGPGRIALGLDARGGMVSVRGWGQTTTVQAGVLARRAAALGLRWAVHTDVARDGMGAGLNVEASLDIARGSGLQVIASGGAGSLEDIQRARRAGLAGVIVGRALYEGAIPLEAVEW
ncbi:MAG: 1-(5-phosphoribosyl)-5-((5-phosphoribosylamino)methylideneamino)imidazole-4-carboxamide isomerase [Chloroflexi bacterium]|nr:1-(5-phosphoribosyl)-5-((5-phosphoribosylamino)methylideneamino)imidazole-4-carboxamide isomerase [Chloroflexota bacterium]